MTSHLDIPNEQKLSRFLVATDTSNDYLVGGQLSQAIIDHLGEKAFLAHIMNLSWLSYDTAYKLSSIEETVTFFNSHKVAIKEWLLRLSKAPTSARLILPSGYTNKSRWQDNGDLLDYLSDSLQKVSRINFDRRSIDRVIFKDARAEYEAVFIADATTKFLATVVGAAYQNYSRKHYPVDLDKVLSL